MPKVKKYIPSIDFLMSSLDTESSLLENINKKHFKNFIFYKTNKFIEIQNMDIELKKKNEIVFYPYKIKFVPIKNKNVKIPLFIESPPLIPILLKNKKIEFKDVEVKNIDNDLTEEEKKYYYQERGLIEIKKHKEFFLH